MPDGRIQAIVWVDPATSDDQIKVTQESWAAQVDSVTVVNGTGDHQRIDIDYNRANYSLLASSDFLPPPDLVDRFVAEAATIDAVILGACGVIYSDFFDGQPDAIFSVNGDSIDRATSVNQLWHGCLFANGRTFERVDPSPFIGKNLVDSLPFSMAVAKEEISSRVVPTDQKIVPSNWIPSRPMKPNEIDLVLEFGGAAQLPVLIN